ncbi:hypothetical protein [Actinotalea subterranea]|uniref:hypothetical protein n=1 Tax=Actinotalea subterranea TaxID=2607497 RepID=UPI0011EF2C0F|nr:hypothetical protein [Actinotalea subterranea]
MPTPTAHDPHLPADPTSRPRSGVRGEAARAETRRRPRPSTGVLTHLAITVLIAAVWLAVGPGDGLQQNHVAELLGVESVWLMSSSVLVLTRSARVERSFGGVAGALWWHRVAGAVGVGLGVVHPVLLVPDGGRPASLFAELLDPLTALAVVLTAWALMTPTSRVASWRGPLGWLARRSYDRWRAMHGVLAAFLVVAMAHGVADSVSLRERPVLAVVYAGVCALGLYAVIERMVITRSGVRDVPGTVVAVERHGTDVAVITIAPERPIRYAAGQFVELGVPVSGERPHPLTLTSAPDQPDLQVAVRAVGTGTARVVAGVRAGDRVSLGPVRGLFRHEGAGARQVWLAGGIGIAPFVSWVRAQGEHYPDHHVDLIWSSRGFETEPFADELLDAALRLEWLDVHLHDTTRLARLTAGDIVAVAGGRADAISVLACGSPAMVSTLCTDLRAAGVPRGRLRTEALSYR